MTFEGRGPRGTPGEETQPPVATPPKAKLSLCNSDMRALRIGLRNRTSLSGTILQECWREPPIQTTDISAPWRKSKIIRQFSPSTNPPTHYLLKPTLARLPPPRVNEPTHTHPKPKVGWFFCPGLRSGQTGPWSREGGTQRDPQKTRCKKGR